MNSNAGKVLPDSRLVVVALLLFQAIAVGVWWIVLLNYPDSQQFFVPTDVAPDTILRFWLADLLGVVFVSVVAAWAVHKSSGFALKLIWFLVGAASYATLFCVAESVRTNQAWIGSAMMAMMAGAMWAVGTMFENEPQPELIRVRRFEKSAAIVATLVQTVFFWGILLWIVPKGIEELVGYCGVRGFHEPYGIGGTKSAWSDSIVALGCVLFCLASCLGLWSGITMAAVGSGTPLPTATAPDLVVKGPYRFVRNPMALAGIAQGVGVGLWMGCSAVLLYALLGGVFWHFAVRPYEESDLQSRFGDSYAEYQKSVRLWLPIPK